MTNTTPFDGKAKLFFILCLVTLFLSFNFNVFRAVNHSKFHNYQNDSEALVIGRLVKSEQDGIFSSEARMGRYMGLEGDFNQNQTRLYYNEVSGGNYEEYQSQIGLQGILLSYADFVMRKLDINKSVRLEIYHATVSLLFAITIASIILVLYFDIGIHAAWILLASIALSKWQIYAGKNLYWMSFTLFLPFLATLIACKLEESGRCFRTGLLAFIVMTLCLIKSVMGYEYISTVLVAMLSPLVYFAAKNKWSYSLILKRFLVTGLAGLTGFLIAITLHIYQLNLSTGNLSAATEIIHERILARTQTDPETYKNTAYYESQTASVIPMVFNGYMLRGGSYRIKIPYLFWIAVFAYISYRIYCNKNLQIKKEDPVARALIISTWFSFLAPLSWFVLAKSHSYIHLYINLILWHVPFMIFGFALIGYSLTPRIRHALKKMSK